MTQLRRNRVKVVNTTNPKIIIQSLIAGVGPEMVRESLKKSIEYWISEMKNDFETLRKLSSKHLSIFPNIMVLKTLLKRHKIKMRRVKNKLLQVTALSLRKNLKGNEKRNRQ